MGHGWSFDPYLVLTAAIAAWHEVGVRRLRRDGGARPHQRRESLLVYAGLVVIDLAVASPVGLDADRYFWVHMVQHLLLLFAGPVLIVAGAPWRPLRAGLPRAVDEAAVRVLRSGGAAPVRVVAGWIWRPWVLIVAFNLIMVVWHLPGPFDASVTDPAVRVWAMHTSLVLCGIAFWLQFIGSDPLSPRLPPLQQFGALFATNAVMFIVAVSIGMIATTSLYDVFQPWATPSLSAVGDQHIGAGILWVCGDFWCLPAMYRAMKAFIREDELTDLGSRVDRILRGARS